MRIALIAAPLAMTAYGLTRIIGRLDGHYGPGLDWQLAHLFGLAGMLLFVPVVFALRTRIGTGRNLITGITLAGLAATIVQFSADMILALAATDRADLRTRQHEFADLPGVQPAVYDIGPLLFFIGIVALAALATRARHLPWWSPAMMLLAVALPPVDLNLMPLTGILMLIALHPLHDTTPTPPRPTTPAVATARR
ncbi:hypothetical protein [Actinoplanes utahensis]|uniref:Uncharacterized protein n=1 Tax=Actinoplanes utahensis TaxID=1869 RepID=A0A0A6X0Q0_ACTUT|nr:hypothetical protein [Actinoplanes utahensis]KHD73597.1 hypothetical protein MB27_34330 [Actinoplanes utahensis]GIF33955.1 hypothetical protein Aut01nite_69410 [Actinoplanes utahensis]